VKDNPPLILFGTQGGSALAMAPIAQRAKVPFLVTIAGSPGVVETGEYIYRATSPQSAYHVTQVKHLANQGVKRLAVVYASDSATLAGLGEDTYPTLAKENGIEIVSSNGVTSTDTELGSVVSRMMKEKPDAVVMLLIGKQNVSVAKALRTGGFEGIIAGQYGIGSEALKALGSAAEGILYPADFTPGMDHEAAQAFVKLFTEKAGREPDLYDANGYVAGQIAVEALKKANGDFSSESVQKAMTEVTSGQLDSATGSISFENRDARVDGVLLEWRDGKENIVSVE
jgi:branched-chain amino acid transport system substrate-binding protein